LVIRRALLFREVLNRHLPVQILDGELVVGSHLLTALSRCLTKDEARARDRQERAFLKEWEVLNSTGEERIRPNDGGQSAGLGAR
jgi:hypothetical protein